MSLGIHTPVLILVRHSLQWVISLAPCLAFFGDSISWRNPDWQSFCLSSEITGRSQAPGFLWKRSQKLQTLHVLLKDNGDRWLVVSPSLCSCWPHYHVQCWFLLAHSVHFIDPCKVTKWCFTWAEYLCNRKHSAHRFTFHLNFFVLNYGVILSP